MRFCFIFPRMLVVVGLVCCGFVEESPAVAEDKVSVLIVDGRNNHNWQITSDALRATLEASGRFTVTVSSAPQSTSPRALRAPKSDKVAVLAAFEENVRVHREQTQFAREKSGERWQDWQPDFDAHDVVLLNYNGQ